MTWIEEIKFNDLLNDAPYLSLLDDNDDTEVNLDSIAQLMLRGGQVKVSTSNSSNEDDDRPDKTVWEAVKSEMIEFLCGSNSKYKDLRKQLDAVKSSGAHVIVPAIAVSIAGHVGVAVASITGLVSLTLGVLLKTGVNGFCSIYYKK